MRRDMLSSVAFVSSALEWLHQMSRFLAQSGTAATHSPPRNGAERRDTKEPCGGLSFGASRGTRHAGRCSGLITVAEALCRASVQIRRDFGAA